MPRGTARQLWLRALPVHTINRLKGTIVTRSIALLPAAAVLVAALSGPAFSQGTPQTLSLMKVDPQSVATGYRTSKVVGSTVVNEANETVGTIDDLIVTPNEKVPFAVLSVGGFLGMGTKYVVVPFSALQVQDKKMVLPGATKELAEEPSGVQVQQLTDRGEPGLPMLPRHASNSPHPEWCALPSGNAHSADGWHDVLEW